MLSQHLISNSNVKLSRLLADRNKMEQHLADAGYAEIFGYVSPVSTPTPTTNEKFLFNESADSVMNRSKMSLPTELELPETERLVVELKKDANGLGITIAGYVCEKEELSGIFVKSVSAGSAADLSGKIRVNDRIIEVDNQSLQGFTNHEAVDVLKKSGTVVCLRLERYLRGPKYEQLQQAIAANELKPQTPSGSGTIFPPSVHSQHSSTQSIGATELARKSSMSSTHSKHNGNFSTATTVNLDSLQLTKEPLDPLANFSAPKMPSDIIPKQTEVDVTPKDKSEVHAIEGAVLNMEKHKYWVEPTLTKEIENTIVQKWQAVLGSANNNIIVAQIRKFAASSGLGISLEGTVDVEGGREVRPHHYIRSILPEGPVGQNGLLRSGDELLGKILLC